MSFTADQLWDLLPAHLRTEDTKRANPDGLKNGQWKPGPLRQLIEVIAGQVAVVEENLEQLYDNQFVETAAPWVLPYLGDLLGIRGLSGGGTLTRAPRAEVGHTIAYRRRKGTAAMLELLGRDVTGWPARAVEFFERLSTTQHVNHVRSARPATLSVRGASQLEFFDSAFEMGSRLFEVRRIAPARGRWNIPNIGLFLWRLRAYACTDTPLTPAGEFADRRHFRFHPLDLDAPLFTRPETEDEFTHLAEPINVPLPITRRLLSGDTAPPTPVPPPNVPTWASLYHPWPNQFHPAAAYYGSHRSLFIETNAATGDFEPIEADEILVCDLSDAQKSGGGLIWGHEDNDLAPAAVLLDPQLGRVVLPEAAADDAVPRVSFHHGFSASLGGGEYDRSASMTAWEKAGEVIPVPAEAGVGFDELADACDAVAGTLDGRLIEIHDNRHYVATSLSVTANGRQVELRAADGFRPVVRLRTQPFDIIGDADGTVTIDGLLITGRGLRIRGGVGRVRLRHCTIIPDPADSSVPSLVVESDGTTVEIENCILRTLRVSEDARIHLRNCIVDGVDESAVALGPVMRTAFAGTWRIEQCTVIGKISARVLELASNSILLAALEAGDDPAIWPAPIVVQRRQEGCVRFCWLPPDARVPHRYQCLPSVEIPFVHPAFTSRRLGDPGYLQLGRFCPEPIRRGAEDESEIGVFHDLFQPQREAHLRARLYEYLRLGLEAGVFFAS